MLRRLCLAIGLMAACLGVSARQPQMPPTPLAPQLQVELIESQNELAVDVPDTATAVGMQFGLLGALIGSGIQNQQAKNAEAMIIPLRDLLVEYRFNEKMEQALRANLASEGLSPDPQLAVRKTAWEAVDAEHAGDVPLEALVLVPHYAMDYEFSQLSVKLTAQWVKRTINPNGKIKTTNQFTRFYSYAFPMRRGAPADRVANWMALGSDGLAASLDEAIGQLVDMLAHDFSPEGRAVWRDKVGNREFVRVSDSGFAGRPIRSGPGWVWALTGRKWTQLQGYHPIVASVADTASTDVAAGAPTEAAGDTASDAMAQPAAEPPVPETSTDSAG